MIPNQGEEFEQRMGSIRDFTDASANIGPIRAFQNAMAADTVHKELVLRRFPLNSKTEHHVRVCTKPMLFVLIWR
jgi:hypothetical protein